MRILILHDEIPDGARADMADALVQAGFIGSILKSRGHQVERCSFTAQLNDMREAISAARPDLVFNLVESVGGEGRLIYLAPALLDSMNIPYTGAGTEPMFLTSGKVLTKRLLVSNGFATPAWHDGRTLYGTVEFPARFIVKSVWEDASIGLDDSSVVIASGLDQLAAEIARRQDSLGGEAFAELFIDGRELNVGLLASAPDSEGMDVLPPAEIEFVDFATGRPRIVGYAAKWDENSPEYANTRRRFDFPASDGDLLEKLRQCALSCAALFDLRGYARVDFRVDAQGRPWVLEINANPCLSPDAGFMAQAARAGLAAEAVMEHIVADAMR